MKTPEQLKGAIRNIAKEKDLHAQEVLQNFVAWYMEFAAYATCPP